MKLVELAFVPLAAVLVLAVTGAGLAAVLARRFPLDAQAALAPLLGAAAFVLASPLRYVGAPARALGLGVVGLCGALSIAVARRVAPIFRHALVPIIVTVTVLGVVSGPSLWAGGWDAAAIDNTDPYLWVSQAKALLEGPAPAPAADFPDRIAYERITELRWPVGLPFTLANFAALVGSDPSAVYAAFAALLTVLLSLAVYVCARACLMWKRRFAVAASLAVPTSAFVFYSTFNGWQAQIALTLFGTLAIFCFRLALDGDAQRREQALAAVFAAAAIGIYGVVYAPFAALLVIAALAWALRNRAVGGWRRLASVSAGFVGVTLVVGAGAIVQALLQVPILLRVPDSPAWELYPHGLPGEALGLIPRLGTASRPPTTWSVVALLLAAAVFAFGVLRRGERGPRDDILLSTGIASLVVIALLQLPGPSPYLSIKFVGYAAPLLILLAVSGLVGKTRLPRLRVATYAATGTCCVFSTLVVVQIDLPHLMSVRELAPLRQSLSRVPDGATVGVDVRDEWLQPWTVYYLRERRVVVSNPNIFLTGFGLGRQRLSTEAFTYVVEDRRPERRGTHRPTLVVRAGHAFRTNSSAASVGEAAIVLPTGRVP